MNTAKARHSSSIEPLESRIAPARVILAGVPNTLPGNDVDYNDSRPADDTIFVNIKNAPATDLIARALGGAAAEADTYYVRMFGGDVLKLFTATNGLTDPFILASRGNSIAFFQDSNGDNEVQPNELMSVSLGANAVVDVRTGVPGDIVANLDEKKTKSTADDELRMNGLVSSSQHIGGLIISSSIEGDIIAGGKINNVRVFGSVNNVLTGSAANGVAIDFFPASTVAGKGTIAFSIPDGVAGAAISNLNVDQIVGRVEAGKGGAGAAGGSLSKIQVTNDPTGMALLAGAGGVANSKRPNGGAGGSVTGVYISGVDDNTPNNLVQIKAGNGGDASAFKRGGNGGKISTVFVGYSLISNEEFPSAALLQDNVHVAAGTGGAGKTGGTGGSVVTVDINVSTPDGAGDEVSVVAGNGGLATVAGGIAAGAGGSISKVALRDRLAFVGGLSDIMLKAGDGGAASASVKGNSGGSITTANVLGFDVHVLAGDGSSGKTGGKGGSLTGVTADESPGVLMQFGDFQAGDGGNGASGAAGAGGRIESFRVINSNVTTLNVLAGDGGDSGTARGGAGGLIRKVDILESGDRSTGIFGVFMLHSGAGGDGKKGGGAGGAISSARFSGIDTSVDLRSGGGGSAAGAGAKGTGGAAGSIALLDIASVGVDALDVPVDGSIRSGQGGNGIGKTGSGGVGGNVSSVNFNVDGDASLVAGDGGNGPNAAPGRGGSIFTALLFGQTGDGELLAGSGGLIGAKPAAGGSIFGQDSAHLSGLFALGTVTVQAGDGTHGGAGGGLRYIGYGSTSPTLVPTPLGHILVKAGDGSAGGSRVGAGGSISNVSGSVASTDGTHPGPYNTTILAGNGGGSSAGSAAGGSISNLDIRRGGNSDGVLTIKAGDAGDSLGASRGAAGGSVTGVAIADVSDANIIRSIAAGDGGNAAKTGGTGGTLNKIDVFGHDIGVRSGEVFGYATMGGLFAGAGGKATKEGRAGSVMNVRAPMIAAIVAGRDAVPKLAYEVSYIYVGIPTDLLEVGKGNVNPDGSYDAAGYAAATFVGAVVDPTVAGANRFHFVDADADGIFELGERPIDGLIMAKKFVPKKTNFTPEAGLTGGDFQFTEITAGSVGVQEVQRLKLTADKFTFVYGGDETVVLKGSATSAAVAKALNALPSIIAAGGVQVLQTGSQTYAVTFKNAGARDAIVAPFYYDFDNVY